MESTPALASPADSESETPSISVDWRLLVPFKDGSRILVGGIAADEIASYLNRVGADAIAWNDTNTANTKFDLIAVPLGFSKVNSFFTPEGLSKIFDLLQPNGTLLIGFSNPIGLRRKSSGSKEFAASPQHMVDVLERARFNSISLYGVLTGLSIPKYIFPLQKDALGFAVYRQFHRKVPGAFRGWLKKPLTLSIFSRILPAYYVTAVAAR